MKKGKETGGASRVNLFLNEDDLSKTVYPVKNMIDRYKANNEPNSMQYQEKRRKEIKKISEANAVFSDEIDNISKHENKKDVGFVKPLEGKITSNFGYRVAPTKGASAGHSGIDIGIPIGTPVRAIADGTVVAARDNMKGYGIGVFIDHGLINGKHLTSEYGHLNSFDVKVGEKVKMGQIIARSGNTGVSTGPHLHLTIRENKTPVDPKKYLGDF